MDSKSWDAIIVGGGVAGLSAALMLGRARRRTLVIDGGEPRNRFAAHMHGVLGHEGIDPAVLLERGRRECADYGVKMLPAAAGQIDATDDAVRVTLENGDTVEGRVLIAATGVTDDLPRIAGLAERWGTAVFHCPYCHGWEVRDRRVGVIPTTPMSAHQVELLRQWTEHVVAFTAELGEIDEATRTRWEARGIEIITEPIAEVLGEVGSISAVRLEGGREVPLDAIFTAPTPKANEALLKNVDLGRTDTPFGSVISVDMAGKTSHPRIWAAGNIVMSQGNVPLSMGAGAMAGAAVNAMLVAEDFDAAVFWEARYGEQQRIWSGEPNAALVDAVQLIGQQPEHAVGSLVRGTALDLGSGEGADALWLARQGWSVTGVEISGTAIARAEQEARAAGAGPHTEAGTAPDTVAEAGPGTMPGSVEFIQADIAAWEDDRLFDLVTASFLHSPVNFPRAKVLRRAAERVAAGGHFVLVSHASAPPWSKRRHSQQAEGHGHASEEHRSAGSQHEAPQHEGPLLPSLADELKELSLDRALWQTITAEVRKREAHGPGGETAVIEDNLIVMRRKPVPQTRVDPAG